MNESKNKEVMDFLQVAMISNPEKYNYLQNIRDMILKIYPETEEKMMYGGIVFFLDGEMYSGLFIFNNHVTLEFSNGYKMKDPNRVLEGSGKYRRHLKIKTNA